MASLPDYRQSINLAGAPSTWGLGGLTSVG
jgi:hypothetical protein